MAKHVKFNGKILIIGCGSVSQCAIPLVLKVLQPDVRSSRHGQGM